jgi:NarL family two-component system response regulator LiaR
VGKLRLMIVDDHAMFREGLRLLLESQPDITVIGEAADVDSAVRLAAESNPDIVLMDVKLGGASGVEATTKIMARNPAIKVIALTMYQDGEMAAAMLQTGAQGYVLKESRASELLRAIRTVAAGGAAIDPQIMRLLMEDYRKLRSPAETTPGFAPRDLDMLRYLAAGDSNAEIASKLCLSRQTVKNLLSELYAQLEVANRTEAVAVALERRLLAHDP